MLGIIASYMTIKSSMRKDGDDRERNCVGRGYAPERRPNRYNTLRNGIFMIGLSLGVIVGMMVDSAFTYDSDWFFLLVPAITIMFGGVAFINFISFKNMTHLFLLRLHILPVILCTGISNGTLSLIFSPNSPSP